MCVIEGEKIFFEGYFLRGQKSPLVVPETRRDERGGREREREVWVWVLVAEENTFVF